MTAGERLYKTITIPFTFQESEKKNTHSGVLVSLASLFMFHNHHFLFDGILFVKIKAAPSQTFFFHWK